jgi:hypothetical protein
MTSTASAAPELGTRRRTPLIIDRFLSLSLSARSKDSPIFCKAQRLRLDVPAGTRAPRRNHTFQIGVRGQVPFPSDERHLTYHALRLQVMPDYRRFAIGNRFQLLEVQTRVHRIAQNRWYASFASCWTPADRSAKASQNRRVVLDSIKAGCRVDGSHPGRLRRELPGPLGVVDLVWRRRASSKPFHRRENQGSAMQWHPAHPAIMLRLFPTLFRVASSYLHRSRSSVTHNPWTERRFPG